MFKFIADNNNPKSLASKARKKRFEFFLNEFSKIKKPIKMLNIGGAQQFWESMNLVNQTRNDINYLD